MRTSYKKEDVILLLKDITGMVTPQTTKERERLIQAGRHYCEMLPIEYVPTEKYMQVYEEALELYAEPTAAAVGRLADQIMMQRGENTVLVSLARAGIPIGILVKRYLKWKYQIEVPHYSISIIRGRGIDRNAMDYLLRRYEPPQLLFIDGWVGKGAILRELEKDVAEYAGVSSKIAVLADPANITDLCGTHEDLLIPSSCLNCTVSGLISRTFLRSDIIGEKDFHGAVYYGELEQADLSYEFIEAVEHHFKQYDSRDQTDSMNDSRDQADSMNDSRDQTGSMNDSHDQADGMNNSRDLVDSMNNSRDLTDDMNNSQKTVVREGDHTDSQTQQGKALYGIDMEEVYIDKQRQNGKTVQGTGMEEVRKIADTFGIEDLNFIKPGIGETTRVLLRRVPWKVLVHEAYKSDKSLRHILRLAEEKNVPIEYFPLQCYKCCGIIKKIADA